MCCPASISGDGDRIYAILNGYTKPDDSNLNLDHPGHKIAMPAITNGAVDDKDGMSRCAKSRQDVSRSDLGGELNLDERKTIGLRVMLFLFVLAGLLYFTKKRVWKRPTERAVPRRHRRRESRRRWAFGREVRPVDPPRRKSDSPAYDRDGHGESGLVGVIGGRAFSLIHPGRRICER